ncbi:MAG: hypothetical protein EH225_11455 [Calditrichaeota bacterium]|nr:hypothetical protein [Calditrichota bacterium]RQV99498.1 MAG: hypothetical protein EH225_11455 [Calditrichota bacterium]
MNQTQNESADWFQLFCQKHKFNVRTRITSGAYLHSYCPHCQKELTEGNVLKLEVINPAGETGIVELSPYLNVYERKTDIALPEGEEVRDLRCPYCHKSLKLKGRKCGLGDSSVAGFLVGVSNVKVPFLICMRIGCPWHTIASEDQDKIILDESDEW